MPYKTDKIKLPEAFDRRRKLTSLQRLEIRNKYLTGAYSQRQLASNYGVSRRLIQFIIDPEKEQKNRLVSGKKVYTKEVWAKVKREHRAYKHRILTLEGVV